MIRLIIAGGRDFSDYALLEASVLAYLRGMNAKRGDVEIVSGCAPGADKLGERFQKQYKLKLKEMPARWNDLTAAPCLVKTRNDGSKYNALAGPNRNTEMAAYATHCICFWDGKSSGTSDMIEKAKGAGLDLEVVEYKSVK
jgi:hypothetical protein